MAASMSHRASVFGRLKMRRFLQLQTPRRYIFNVIGSNNVCRSYTISVTSIQGQSVNRRAFHLAARLLQIQDDTVTDTSDRDHDDQAQGTRDRGSQGSKTGRSIDTEAKTKIEHIPRKVKIMRDRMRQLHGLPDHGENNSDTHYYINPLFADKWTNSITMSSRNTHPSSKDQNDSPSATEYEEDDFFGIRDMLPDDSVKTPNKSGGDASRSIKEKQVKVPLTKKFKDILKVPPTDKDQEKVIDLPYGILRRDADNRPTKHGYINATNDEDWDEYNQPTLTGRHATSQVPRENWPMQPIDDKQGSKKESEFNYFDGEYFGSVSGARGVLKSSHNDAFNNDVAEVSTSFLSSAQGKDPTRKTGDKLHHTLDQNDQGANYFDQQYFDGENNTQIHPKIHPHDSESSEKIFPSPAASKSSAQGKDSTTKTGDKLHHTLDQNVEETVYQSASTDQGANYFDQQYFDRENNTQIQPKIHPHDSKSSEKFFPSPAASKLSSSILDKEDKISTPESISKIKIRANEPNIYDDQYLPANNDIKASHSRETGLKVDMALKEDVYVEGKTRQRERRKKTPQADIENPVTAYDYAMKSRNARKNEGKKDNESQTSSKWDGAVDSKGFRILKSQVRDINNIPQDVVVKILHDSVLYENDDFIAIDKPYGLPSHGGPGIHHSVGKLTSPLADRMKLNQLQLVHRLDKETTGVMLLAKTDDALHALRSYFKERKVIKRYWVITKGIPNPRQGVIDIPMVESEVGNRYRMKLLPYKSAETSVVIKKQHSDLPRKDAITNYKVLDSNNSSALVECEPGTGVKHQIRCHLAFALNTPILGDHKYSHFSKMAPQKLPSDMIQRLHIRQPTVRYVPMHLHAKDLVLPQFYDGRNVFISSRLPLHFVQNMKWLQLKPPAGR